MSGGIGRAIRDARIKRGMTLRQLAEAVGVSAPFQSDLEHERRGTKRLAEYALHLGVSEEVLRDQARALTAADIEWANQHPEVVALIRRRRKKNRSAGGPR